MIIEIFQNKIEQNGNQAGIFERFLLQPRGMKPLTLEALELQLAAGHDRNLRNFGFTGDVSGIIFYQDKAGVVISYALNDQDLKVVQIQGVKQGKGFRVNCGLDVPGFFAEITRRIAADPENGIERVVMPHFAEIEGAVNASKLENTKNKYDEFAHCMQMSFSQDERLWVAHVNNFRALP